MATRGAAAKAIKAARQQPQHYVPSDDSDDEAPEIVSKANAEEQARDQLRQEKEAKAQATAAAAVKRKRKTRAELVEETEDVANEEDTETTDAPELPADVLSAIATRNEEDQTELELEEAREQHCRKRAAAAKKRVHIRDFGSVQVQTLEALDAAESRKLTEAAAAFLDRKAAPHRVRMNVLDGHSSQFTKKQKQRL